MGIWDKLRAELIDIIEWLDDTRDTMVWRFPRYDNEIKYGAKLIVREGQAAAFVNEGALADTFAQPGTYTLVTQNLPVLSKLRGWKYGFESPFKSEVYFCSMRTFTDRKWGTKNPIMLRDPEFGPTRLRAFGSFAIRVGDVPTFLRNVVGTDHRFSIEDIGEQLRDLLVARFADALGDSKIPVLDLAANQDDLGKILTARLQPDFDVFGLKLVNLVVENISLPPEVEQALDTRTKMGVIGDLNRYAQFQAANAIGDAAKNPNGIAGVGAGLGVGFGIANQMGQAFANNPALGNPGPSAPPPVPGSSQASYFVAQGGQQKGPFTLEQLRDEVNAGRVQRATLAWKAGMPQWAPVDSIADLNLLFANVPPPLPKE
ncbi:MAG TPA: SPFH domain-containing protein [Tepidisphaeraceae bacterium]|nr:SPFH domain-containing protein [Tepidisphaeraceae bacterium]